MGATAAVHPTDPILQAYGLGKLDQASAESVAHHLEVCSACQRRVAEMSSDSFLGRLQKAQGQPGPSGPVVSSLAGLSMMDAGPSSPQPPPTSSLPSGLVDHPVYEVIRELGQGGMGTVYLALNRLMGRHEVLKVVSSHLMNRRGVLDRFMGEIRNAARLHHTNIVTAYSATPIADGIVFAMEYVEGLDLAKLVAAKGALPVANACNYVHQAALGLQHAHEESMVHRDIKPSNLMLAKLGNRAVIKVLDFGLAKVKSEGAADGGLTHEGQMLGTPQYVAPEQTIDARTADIRADIYSLGCSLYCLLTGGPPFQATSLYELLQAHHSMDALPLNLARPEVPVELAALVARMMAKEPERRFQEPRDVAQALMPFFKKGAVATRSSAEVSRSGSAEEARASIGPRSVPSQPATTVASKPPIAPVRPDPMWESLIDLHKMDRAGEPAPAGASVQRRGPQWKWPVMVAGALLLALVITWAVILRVKDSNGIIEFVDLPNDAEVLVDGETVAVNWPRAGSPAVVSVAAGTHKVKVKKDGLETTGDEVTVETDGKSKFTVRFVDPVSVKTANDQTEETRANATGAPDRKAEVAAVRPVPGLRSNRNNLPETTIGRGTWTIEADELVQSEDRGNASLAFGDPDWSDYNLTMEAKRVSGRGHGFHILFHRLGSETFCWYGLGVFDNKGSEMYFRVNGQGSRAGDTNQDNWAWKRLNVGQWYTIKIKVRKSKFECYLDNSLMFEEAHSSFAHGRIGLNTRDIQARFRHIKVTDPEGRVLFEGLPDLGTDNVAGSVTSSLPGRPTEVLAGESLRRRSTSPVEKIGKVSLFDGKDLSGWNSTIQNGSEWVVVDGFIEGHGGGPGKPAVLVSQRQNLTSFRLRAEVRCKSGDYGWIELRRSDASGKMNSYVITNVGSASGNGIPVGSVTKAVEFEYGTYLGWDLQPEPSRFAENVWHTVDIMVSGNRILTTLDGKTLSDYTDVKGSYSSGGIALGCGGATVLQYRSITIEDVPQD